MEYKIVRDASLRKSKETLLANEDERYNLYEAILSSSTYSEYEAKVPNFSYPIVSKKSGKTWYATTKNCFDYLVRNGRIELVQ